MILRQRIAMILTGAIFVGLLVSTGAQAANLTFNVRSDHPNIVSLEFYSDDRNHAWPGGDEVYLLEDSDAHSYTLSCERGENVCLGAWVRGQSQTHWGVGRHGKQSCEACCFTCDGGETPIQILNR